MNHKVVLGVAILWLLAISGNAQVMPGLKTGTVTCGAERTGEYTSLLRNVNVGVVANPTSRIGSRHLVDSMLGMGIRIGRVFAPEHGFRGEAEAGEEIQGGKDVKTGLSVVSLYGNHRKPTPEDMKDLDCVVFDIQDVGVRFYTYISTLHYVMEACAEHSIPLLVLDRPNPNGFYVDGPILDTAYRSFVGMDPVPVVHGLTIGEYALMVNEEGWLGGGRKCELKVVPCLGWDHKTEYILPVKPSPNLPDQVSVYLYPGLCFFEGTVFSVGRGTRFPFQVYGHPEAAGSFSFTPVSIPGVSLRPPHEGKVCYGSDLRKTGVLQVAESRRLMVDWVIEAYRCFGKRDAFFNSYFNTLAGTDQLRRHITEGKPIGEIRKSWQKDLIQYRQIRKKYLLYPD